MIAQKTRLISDFIDSLLDCSRTRAKTILDEASNVLGVEKVFSELIPAALNTIGQRWDEGQVSLMQVYAVSRIVDEAIAKLSPEMQPGLKIKCKVVIGALDYHGLGKNIMSKFLKANGAEVLDLGINVPPERFAEAGIENNANAILVSALMLHSCPQTLLIKQTLESKHTKIPIMVGGAPFNFDKTLWKRVGADAKGHNVCQTFQELQRLLKK